MSDTGPAVHGRDRALLRAIAANRCTLSPRLGPCIRVDGLPYADQFAAGRLTRAGLVAPAGPAGTIARLTAAGHAMLDPGVRSPAGR